MLNKYKFSSHTIGGLQVALANSFVGMNIICSKYLLNTNSISILLLLELRYLIACFIFVPILFQFKKKGLTFYLTENKFSVREKYIYFLMAISGGALFNVIYMAGMRHTTAFATGIISSTLPLFIILLSFIFFKQRIQKYHIASALLVSIGIGILNISLVGDNITENKAAYLGNFIVFIAMLPEAMFTIFAKMLKTKISPMISAYYINLINLIVCTPFLLFSLHESLQGITRFNLFLCFLIGLSGALFYFFYNSGISKINAQTAGILTGIVPLSTALLSVLFLNESINTLTVIGMTIVLTSIYIGIRKTSEKATR